MKKLLLVLTVVAMASFLLVGCLPTTNNAPVITSTPGLTATVGTEYTYTVTATDADGDTLTYSVSPSDLEITANVITWTPTATGTMDVIVTVTDGTDPVTQSFTITVSAAPVINVAPVITSTAVLIATVGEAYTYDVNASDANTGDVLVYSLTTDVAGMGINSASGLINWTPTFAGSYVVGVMVSDGALTATEGFTVVASDPVVLPFVASIVYEADHFYDDGTDKFVRSGEVDVKVTLLEALVAGESLEIQWNDGANIGGEDTLTQVGTTLVYEGTIDFGHESWGDCELVCVEVIKLADCCPDQTFTDIVKVDEDDPCADFELTFTDCCETDEDDYTGVYMSFTSIIAGDCGDLDVCEDCCSGVGDWTFTVVPDDTDCGTDCDVVAGSGCEIDGDIECGCLVYAAGGDETEVVYDIDVSIKDNVGNEFTDTWTITLDTDSVVSVEFADATVLAADAVAGVWTIDYTDCTATLCD